MGLFLIIAFIFFIGSLVGWIIELFYRKFISKANPERKWINPGFLVGPYLPLYGFGLSAMYLLAQINVSFIENKTLQKVLLFILMAIVMTIIEYIAGIIFIKGMKVKLWDYTNEWGNIQGIICPRFSFYWAVLSAIYYFFIHPHILNSLYWLAQHLAFSFIIGFFYGIFLIDFCYSVQILVKVKKFAIDHNIIVKYQELKRSIQIAKDEYKEKKSFVFAFKSEHSLSEHLKKYLELEMAVINDNLDNAKEKFQDKLEETQEKIQDRLEENQEKIQSKINQRMNKK